jgi:hypothetical protein
VHNSGNIIADGLCQSQSEADAAKSRNQAETVVRASASKFRSSYVTEHIDRTKTVRRGACQKPASPAPPTPASKTLRRTGKTSFRLERSCWNVPEVERV